MLGAEQGAPAHEGVGAAARPRRLAWRLVVLCAAVTMPIFAFIALLLAQYAESARGRLEREGLEAVRNVAEDLDRDITSLTAILETLAFSTRLEDRDFERFHKLAAQISRTTGLPVVLSDPSGQQIVNTRVDFGAELPRSAIPYDEVIATRKPIVSDLFRGAVSRSPVFAIAAPVLNPDSGAVDYVLSFSVDPERLLARLRDANLEPNALAGVIDRNGRMMARTIEHEKYLFSTPNAFLVNPREREGQARIVNREGLEVLGSFTHMRSTGWTVAYAVPVAVVDRPVHTLLWQVLGVGVLTALIAATGGFVYSRRIVGALSDLGHSAVEVGRGSVVEPVRTPVTEINEVGERLARASRALRQTTEAKDALLYEVNHRVKNSLAVVTSLLAMQVRQTPDEAMRRGLDDLRTRIDVMSSVHQRLYETGGHDRLDLGLFLHEIACDMTQALGGAGRRLVSDCEPGIVVGVDRTTPLALIVGELLTNAFKHGEGESGEVSLSVKRAGDGQIAVSVADDGPGLPAGFEARSRSRMGMRIVTGLVRQLRGTLETNAGAAGARFTITLAEAAT